MSILVDFEIREAIADGKLVIEPFEDALVQPNSYDVRLANVFSWREPGDKVIDPYDSETVCDGLVTIEDDHFIVKPGQFVLGATIEKFSLPADIVGQLTGK